MSFFPLLPSQEEVYFVGLPGQSFVDIQPPNPPNPPKFNGSYSNTSGINVSIEGDIDSVRAVIETLTQNPPILGSSQNMPTPSMPQQVNIPPRTGSINGNPIIYYNNHAYSHSGIVIIATDRHNNSYVVLFKNANHEYQELSGTLDNAIIIQHLSQPEKALFENAKKQVSLGSFFTFDIKTPSLTNKDITYQDQTLCKAYLHIVRVNDILDISNAFMHNRQQVRDSFVDIKFVETRSMQEYLTRHTIDTLQTTQIISHNRTLIKCNSSTLEILSKMAGIWGSYIPYTRLPQTTTSGPNNTITFTV